MLYQQNSYRVLMKNKESLFNFHWVIITAGHSIKFFIIDLITYRL